MGDWETVFGLIESVVNFFLFLVGIFVFIFGIFIILRLISLCLILSTSKIASPGMAFVPFLGRFYEGKMMGEILEWTGWKSLCCKLIYTLLGFSLIYVRIVDSLRVKPDRGFVFELLIILGLLVFGVVSFIKVLALRKVGYDVISAIFVVLLLQPFYLFFLNNKLKDLKYQVLLEKTNNVLNP